VRELKRDSPDRFLRVDVKVDVRWVAALRADVVRIDASGSRVRLQPGTDATAVLDAIRAHAEVTDFGVESPALSELFLAAAGEDISAFEDEEARPRERRSA
jgi:hypothetical protein